MSSVTKTGNVTHDTNCLAALSTLQATIAGVTSQATVNAAYIAYYKTCLASAITNSCGADTFKSALRSLGQQA